MTTKFLEAKVADVIAVVERRLADSVVLEVVPREHARIFRNQILVSDNLGDFLITVIKTRTSRRK